MADELLRRFKELRDVLEARNALMRVKGCKAKDSLLADLDKFIGMSIDAPKDNPETPAEAQTVPPVYQELPEGIRSADPRLVPRRLTSAEMRESDALLDNLDNPKGKKGIWRR
jgi:hypothetical protein